MGQIYLHMKINVENGSVNEDIEERNHGLIDNLRIGLKYKYTQTTSVPVSNNALVIGSENNGSFFDEGELYFIEVVAP